MGSQRTTFDKLQRERAKKAKQQAKRERRQERGAAGEGDAPIEAIRDAENLTADQLIERIEAVHRAYADEKISYEEFEEIKADLYERLSQLPIG